jgi:hypothetical protein
MRDKCPYCDDDQVDSLNQGADRIQWCNHCGAEWVESAPQEPKELPIIFLNCTPHEVRLNDGRVFPPSGILVRISAEYTAFDADGIASIKYGELELPDVLPNVRYIVSAIVKAAAPQREDFVCPATGHPEAVRVNGQIVSVPGFVR